MPCLFDRIVRSLGTNGPNENRSIDSRSYRDAVRRDLEWLLNAKRRHRREELKQTVLSAGGKAAPGSALSTTSVPTTSATAIATARKIHPTPMPPPMAAPFPREKHRRLGGRTL